MPWNMHRTYGISMGRLFCMGEKQSRSEGKTKKGKEKNKKNKKILGLARVCAFLAMHRFSLVTCSYPGRASTLKNQIKQNGKHQDINNVAYRSCLPESPQPRAGQ